MSTIYLIRHGQAGTREHYDVLSELGREQARLLGLHLAEREVRFDAIYAGGLARQQETARLATEPVAGVGGGIVTDARWNEFILKDVYQWMAPRLMRESPTFAEDFETMQREIAVDPHNVRGASGRCDRAVIEAWMANRYPDYDGETWEAFRARVRAGFAALFNPDPARTVAVFTSVTPIAVCLGQTLSLSNEKILRLMAVIYNSSITVMKIRFSEPLLFQFNLTPHLSDERMQTFR